MNVYIIYVCVCGRIIGGRENIDKGEWNGLYIYMYIYLERIIYIQHTWMPAAAILRPCKVAECGPY